MKGVVDDCEGSEAEEVHFEQTHLFDGAHVVRRDDGFVFGAGDGDEFSEGAGGDDDAGRVDAGAADETFEAQSRVDKFTDFGFKLVGLSEWPVVGEDLRNGDANLALDHLGNPIDFAVRHIEGTAYILDRRFSRHRIEGDDLGDLVSSIFATDVLDDLSAAIHAEVNIDIWHGDTFGVEETLEEELVLKGINVGDLHAVGHERAGCGTAAGANGNMLLASVADKVPDDHKIAGKLHLLDAGNFAVQTCVVIGFGLAEYAAAAEVGDVCGEAFLKPFAADLLEVAVEIHALWDWEFGERVVDFAELQVAALRELHGARDDVRVVREESSHLFSGLDVELFSAELEAFGVVHAAGGLDAEEDLVGAGIGVFDVMRIVGGDERDVEVLLHAKHIVNNGFVRTEVVVLNLKEEVSLAEHLFEFAGS